MKRLLHQLRQSAFVPWLAAGLIRGIARTLRLTVDDRSGLLADEPPVIWLFWHNRMFLAPYLHQRRFPTRPGAVLTSPSGDGEVIARTTARFGFTAIRGSSNKRPAAALREMTRALRDGYDLGITPDGPRGPRYALQPGAVKLAQLAGCAILPLHVRYHGAWRLRGWDQFMIPRPFSRVEIIFGELLRVARTDTDETFESERQRIEAILRQHTEP